MRGEPIIELKDLAGGVVQIRMRDRANKNTFTDELLGGLTGSFALINKSAQCKAVILTGYDGYFASGSMQAEPGELLPGQLELTDRNVCSLVLNCPVPVIAAMQGDGIGGGLALGMFADFIILGCESVYTADFMNHGVAPGMGLTFILPKKLGFALGVEMMLGASTYHGDELKKRGIPFPVLPRARVLPHAMKIARTLAEKSRASLVTLKNQLVGSIREQLPQFIEREAALHELTVIDRT